MSSPWAAFCVLRDTIVQQIDANPLDPAVRAQLQAVIANLAAVPAEGADAVLTAYFEQPPSHVAAVNTLDHSQFVTSIPFTGCLFPLRDVLLAFSKLPAAYATIWLALLDVAQASNPSQIQSGPGRAFIQQQMLSTTVSNVNVPQPPQLDGMLNTILGAFPDAFPGIHPRSPGKPLGYRSAFRPFLRNETLPANKT